MMVGAAVQRASRLTVVSRLGQRATWEMAASGRKWPLLTHEISCRERLLPEDAVALDSVTMAASRR